MGRQSEGRAGVGGSALRKPGRRSTLEDGRGERRGNWGSGTVENGGVDSEVGEREGENLKRGDKGGRD